jgi:hypothetical protein
MHRPCRLSPQCFGLFMTGDGRNATAVLFSCCSFFNQCSSIDR